VSKEKHTPNYAKSLKRSMDSLIDSIIDMHEEVESAEGKSFTSIRKDKIEKENAVVKAYWLDRLRLVADECSRLRSDTKELTVKIKKWVGYYDEMQ
jgi:hypothetical protein